MPLRATLETLLLELLDSVYDKWAAPLSLDDLGEEDVTAEAIGAYMPYYAAVAAMRAKATEAVEHAAQAVAQADEAREKATKLQASGAESRMKIVALQDQLAKADALREQDSREKDEAKETAVRFREQVKFALSDFAEMEVRDQTMRADIRNFEKMLRESQRRTQELEEQVTVQTNRLQEKERELATAEVRLVRSEADTKEVGYMRGRLLQLEQYAEKHGMDFARRLVEEVCGGGFEDLYAPTDVFKRVMDRKLKEVDQQKPGAVKAVLDLVVAKFKAMHQDISGLQAGLDLARVELQETRDLVPVWNAAAAQDLMEAFDGDAAVHREIFSMKDKRSFAGLGTGRNVPPYLRAEGFVRHTFVSKGELERFMRNFHAHLASDERGGAGLTPEQLHLELFHYMELMLSGEALVEFGYAFICGLEAYRDDPDFELFDLMLCGAAHPSLMQDQAKMLAEFQNLLCSCQVPADDVGRQVQANEQASQRLIRAVLQVVFPEKSPARHNSIRRALHETLQLLWDAGKSPEPGSVYIADLFQSSNDGEQTVLIEEVRRQHYNEIIEFTSLLANRLRDASDLEGYFPASKFKKVYHECDPNVTTPNLERVYRLAFRGDDGAMAPYKAVLTTLRHGTLLRPELLWVKANPKDVVDQMVVPVSSRAQEQLAAVSGAPAAGDEGEVANNNLLPGRRARGCKVIDNPVAKMRSDTYSTPEGLERAIAGHPQQADLEEDDAA